MFIGGGKLNELPAILKNLDYLRCHFCKSTPEHIEPRWHGRLGGSDRWLSKAKYNLQDFSPSRTDEPSQGGLFDCAGSG